MSFINASPFFSIVKEYRMLWIGGKYGGHKTSLGFVIAEQFLQKGYKLITNIRSIWSDDMNTIDFDENGQLHLVVLMDEGGEYFKTSRQTEAMTKGARKMDVVFLFPSYFPPARNVQVLSCFAMFNLKAAGVPLYIYQWRAKLGPFQDTGVFGWWDPSTIYGVYDTMDPSDNGDKIVRWIMRKADEYRRKFHADDENEADEEGDGIPTMEEESADILADAASAISDAADTISSIPYKSRRRHKI